MFRIAFLLLPEFSLLGTVSAAETLRVANSLLTEPQFSTCFVHDTEPSVVSSSGMPIQASCHLRDLVEFDALVVCSSFKHHKYENAETQALIRRFDRHGKMLGGIESGVYHIAKAGVLNGHLATAHFNNMPLFAQQFPKVRFVKQVYTWSESRMTCAGGTSAVDMMLHLIRQRLGDFVATRAANIIIFPNFRSPEEPQGDLFNSRYKSLPPSVREACRIMEDTIAAPVKVSSIAQKMGLSRRHLDRIFEQSLSCTATECYRMIRLSRARKLLRATSKDLTSVSIACGFGSYSHFLRHYKKAYGVSPAVDRQNGIVMLTEPTRFSPLHDLHPYQNQLDPQRMV